MGYSLNEILRNFIVEADIASYGNGHINDTYVVEMYPKYILQRINTDIFADPYNVMENISNVTNHIRKKIIKNGGNADREVLTVINTINNEPFYRCEDGSCFRLYKFIDNAVSYDIVDDPQKLKSAGVAFGKFQKYLSDFPMDKLHETIKDFHNTPVRFEAFKKALDEDIVKRADSVKEEIKFVLDRAHYCDVVVNEIKSGNIPLRVTHNDTKLNNVMLDAKTNEGVCVIDLDTVMPGSLLYDYGDALRFGGNTGAEDEADLSKVNFSDEMFEAFTEGFLSQVKDTLTKSEKENLVFSIKLMTFECGMRFLTDYLNGDTYFKVHKKDHNLLRCRTQFKLISDIESKEDKLNKKLNEIIESL